MLKDTGSLKDIQFTGQGGAISRKMVIAILLGVALIAFEIFNFDTTQYAPVSYTHLRAHETVLDLVCRLLLEKKKHLNHLVV